MIQGWSNLGIPDFVKKTANMLNGLTLVSCLNVSVLWSPPRLHHKHGITKTKELGHGVTVQSQSQSQKQLYSLRISKLDI